nr:MAG TPA: hypothetical protein [Siphoviridae sp. ctEy724]
MEIGLLMRYDKVYGFFHEDNEAKPVVLIYSGDRTAEFSSFSYLVDGAKGAEKHYKFLSNDIQLSPHKDGWIKTAE